jgi:hypothetical protein
LLDGDGAFDCIHDAGELGKNTVAGGVYDTPAEFADHRQHDRLMLLEIAHRARLVRAHQRAITGDICGQDGSEPARLAFTHGSFSGSFGRPCRRLHAEQRKRIPPPRRRAIAFGREG